jgi:spore coat polysaccharide biosynthesis predicted glycosyltransferase SpsG
VIASFGNLVYEALSLGAPVCVVGQKAFQISLSEKLAALDLCVSAGAATPGREADIRSAIERTLDHRDALSQRALAAIDGRGFERIAGMIVEAARRD